MPEVNLDAASNASSESNGAAKTNHEDSAIDRKVASESDEDMPKEKPLLKPMSFPEPIYVAEPAVEGM